MLHNGRASLPPTALRRARVEAAEKEQGRLWNILKQVNHVEWNVPLMLCTDDVTASFYFFSFGCLQFSYFLFRFSGTEYMIHAIEVSVRPGKWICLFIKLMYKECVHG